MSENTNAAVEAVESPAVSASAPATKAIQVDYFGDFDFAGVSCEMEDLLKAGAHFGHVKSRRQPKMEQYIFTTRKNINIIDLAQTKEQLDKASAFLREVARSGKPILFVGMKKQTHDVALSLAKRLGQSYVIDRWLGGTLTNFGHIRGRAKYLKETSEKVLAGDFKKYTKFEQSRLNEELARLEKKVGGIQNMTELPGAIVLIDAKEADLAQKEAMRMGVPLVGIVDTNTDPSHIDYPIAANDDAVSSLRLILAALGKVIYETPAASKTERA